jgi:hypothetical protein
MPFNYDNAKSSLVIMRYTNIKTGQIFLGGASLGLSEELSITKLDKTMMRVYDNRGFLVLKTKK